MTREEIEQLYVEEPNCFETDREEQWYKVGLKEGLAVADSNMKQPDWKHYRIQAAIAAMQGMLANPKHHDVQVESGVPFSNFYAVNAVMCADALVAELKKGGQDE